MTVSSISTRMLLHFTYTFICTTSFLPLCTVEATSQTDGVVVPTRVFYHMQADSPTIAKTIPHTRSDLECAVLCSRQSDCAGLSFTPGSGCALYTTELRAATGSGTSKSVYTLDKTATCTDNSGYEILTLDSNQYCIGIRTNMVFGTVAREACRLEDATVVALETVNKINDFQSILTSRSLYNTPYWVGLYDTEEEGTWYWDNTGTNITDKDPTWRSGQPNGLTADQPDQDCGYMDGNSNLQDKECTGLNARYACELTLV